MLTISWTDSATRSIIFRRKKQRTPGEWQWHTEVAAVVPCFISMVNHTFVFLACNWNIVVKHHCTAAACFSCETRTPPLCDFLRKFGEILVRVTILMQLLLPVNTAVDTFNSSTEDINSTYYTHAGHISPGRWQVVVTLFSQARESRPFPSSIL